MFMTSDQSITSRSRPASAIVPVRLEYGTRIVEWTEHFQLRENMQDNTFT